MNEKRAHRYAGHIETYIMIFVAMLLMTILTSVVFILKLRATGKWDADDVVMPIIGVVMTVAAAVSIRLWSR